MKRPAFPAPAATRARVTRWICLACIGLIACAGDEQSAPPPRQELQLIAGNIGGRGVIDGTGAAARFSIPSDVALDAAGNLYVVDGSSNTVRKISPAGEVTTIAGSPSAAGSADGTGAAARFFGPQGITVDATGNVYVVDTANHTIRRITSGGVVTTLAGTAGVQGPDDGTGAAAQFNSPEGIATDASGNLYVCDTQNHTIRKITPAGFVSTLAGAPGIAGNTDGSASAARFRLPQGVAAGPDGNFYVGDRAGLRRITAAGVVTTLLDTTTITGPINEDYRRPTPYPFSVPKRVAADSEGNLYLAGGGNATIWKRTPTGTVTVLAGTARVMGSDDGVGPTARFRYPGGMAADAAGAVYVADSGNATIRRIAPDGTVTTFAGMAMITGAADGVGPDAQFQGPRNLTADGAGNLYVADGANSTIRRISPEGVVTTLAGTAWRSEPPLAAVSRAAGPSGAAATNDGTGPAARFNSPWGIAADTAGTLYVADTGSHTIRMIGQDGVVATVAGNAGSSGSSDGIGADARFSSPAGMAADAAGNLYVVDRGNGTIRKITPGGVVSTLAGTAGAYGYADGVGPAARFLGPTDIAADSSGNLYLTDGGNRTIRKITPGGAVTTLAGTAGVAGSANGTGAAARFNGPDGIAADSDGNLYVTDGINYTLRKVTPAGVVTTVAGVPGQQGIRLGSLPAGLDVPQGVTVVDSHTLAVTSGASVLKVILR